MLKIITPTLIPLEDYPVYYSTVILKIGNLWLRSSWKGFSKQSVK